MRSHLLWPKASLVRQNGEKRSLFNFHRPAPLMKLLQSIMIEPLGEPDCDEFFPYLNEHCSENGNANAGYFLPLSQKDSRFTEEKAKAFRAGLAVPVGCPG